MKARLFSYEKTVPRELLHPKHYKRRWPQLIRTNSLRRNPQDFEKKMLHRAANKHKSVTEGVIKKYWTRRRRRYQRLAIREALA